LALRAEQQVLVRHAAANNLRVSAVIRGRQSFVHTHLYYIAIEAINTIFVFDDPIAANQRTDYPIDRTRRISRHLPQFTNAEAARLPAQYLYDANGSKKNRHPVGSMWLCVAFGGHRTSDKNK
jgi:hypothetical protein